MIAFGVALAAAFALGLAASHAEDGPGPSAPQTFALHGQTTVVEQASVAFRSRYAGPQSLDPHGEAKETWDVTLYAGVRPWPGAEIWINPEIDQGFGISDTLGAAGFPSGEAYKVGAASPYLRLQRLFLRQTFDLSGAPQPVEADLNQLAGSQRADRLVITVGKFGAVDIFDANDLAHDPREDFLNWSVIDAGAYDYAADAWGYTEGVAVEWYQGPWTTRLGLFDLSEVPNGAKLDPHFSQFQADAEVERRYALGGRPGSVKLTGFLSHGRMGRFADAVALAQATGQPASTALVRRFHDRAGVSFDLRQEITGALGLFARGGTAGGEVEPYAFSDIDRTLSAGLSLKGDRWGRRGDVFGVAGVVNQISRAHQAYLAAGGLGILVGDGRLPHPGAEHILETYYSLALGRIAHLSADYQMIDHPAYNRDRGPVSIFAARLHAQF